MARERYWGRPSKPRLRLSSAPIPTKLTDDGRQRLVRHGHLPEREIMTGIGAVAVRCPRVRDRVGEGGEHIRFSSTILPPYARRSKSLAVCGKTGKFELLPFRYGALCWWFSRLARHKGSFSFLYGVRLCGNQFRDADQIVGDEVQQESSGDTSNPAMLSLAHRAMLLAPAKDAFDHFAALLRHAIARVPCRAGIDRASPPLADFG